MFEFEQKYKRGKRTFLFLYLKHGWLFNLVGLLFLLLAWAIYYGPFYSATANFLDSHPNWYITSTMLSQWLVLLAAASFIMALLESRIMYAHYKFLLDDHAFNLYKGVFFIRETIIPYQQISNVNITRPYHYRIFGISQLDILTAADKGAIQGDDGKDKKRKLLIPIIDAHIARDLARQLMECASKKRKGIDLHETALDVEDEAEEESDDEEVPAAEAVETETFDTDDDDEKEARPKIVPKEAGDDITVDSKKSSEDDLYPTIDLRNL